MKSFIEFMNEKLSESLGDEGQPSHDMRVSRPGAYTHTQELNLLDKIEDPERRRHIQAVLQQHPEMAAKLAQMIDQAVLGDTQPMVANPEYQQFRDRSRQHAQATTQDIMGGN